MNEVIHKAIDLYRLDACHLELLSLLFDDLRGITIHYLYFLQCVIFSLDVFVPFYFEKNKYQFHYQFVKLVPAYQTFSLTSTIFPFLKFSKKKKEKQIQQNPKGSVHADMFRATHLRAEGALGRWAPGENLLA